MRVMVVDDDPTALKGLSRILEEEGYSVETARNGREALKKIEKEDFDIVLSDMRMPGIDGMGLLKRLKEISPETAVVMITAYGSIQNAVDAMKDGAKDYICKPINPEDLVSTMQRVTNEVKFLKSGEGDLKKMMQKHSISSKEYDLIIKAVSNPVRRGIMGILKTRSLSFTSLTEKLDISDPPKLSFHLRVLKNATLIDQDSDKKYLLSELGQISLKILEMLKSED